jgi:hypothetical protein
MIIDLPVALTVKTNPKRQCKSPFQKQKNSKVQPRTYHEGPGGRRVLGLLFL